MRYLLADGRSVELDVTEDFAVKYTEMEYRDSLIERKETRRHQSLDKLIIKGFEISDKGVNIEEEVERQEEISEIHKALKSLTNKQRVVLIAYAVHGLSFRAIGDKFGISKETAREHYQSAVKKMKRILQNTLSKDSCRGF